MNRAQHFVRIHQFTINIDGISYIEQSEEWSTIIHFNGGKSLELGEEAAKEFMHALETVIDKIPSWNPEER